MTLVVASALALDFTGEGERIEPLVSGAWVFGFAAILAESVGALALIFGFASRVAALGVGAVFAVAVATIHGKFGFFMNWDGAQKGEGIEYFILGLALVAIVVVRGGGAWSVDRAFTASPAK